MHDKARGFTLIEVLIALLVISIAVAAILKALNAQVLVYNRIQDASSTRWVAMNVIAKMQAGILPALSSVQEGQENMMGEVWYWKAVPRDSGASRILRVDVSVARSKQHLDQGSVILGFVLLD